MKIDLDGLSKSYDGRRVLEKVSLHLESGGTYCLMGPSGSGKTTLLRILLGLEQPDSGKLILDSADTHQTGNQTGNKKSVRLAAVFQEDRLCEGFSPLENVLLAADRLVTADTVRAELCRLLPEESITRPVYTLSGGMKRRTAICRALLAQSDAILMDEPFTGLDEQTKLHVIKYIQEKSVGKLLLITTHQEEDIGLLDGRLVTLREGVCIF